MKPAIAVIVVLLAGRFATEAASQNYRMGADISLSALSAYPRYLEDGCAGGRGYGPAVRGHFRPHWLFSMEATAALQIGVGGTRAEDCGRVWTLPAPNTTRVHREHDATRSPISVAADARLVLTPMGNGTTTPRVFGGVAAYPGNSTRGWLAGGGLHHRTTWGGVIVDAERWAVSTHFRDVRVVYGGLGDESWTTVGSGRDTESFWQLRAGVLFWWRD